MHDNHMIYPVIDYSTQKQCRICLEEEGAGDMLAPCRCGGSMAWVHRNCLDSWRISDLTELTMSQCPTCKQNYIIDYVPLENNEKRRRIGYNSSILITFYFIFISIVSYGFTRFLYVNYFNDYAPELLFNFGIILLSILMIISYAIFGVATAIIVHNKYPSQYHNTSLSGLVVKYLFMIPFTFIRKGCGLLTVFTLIIILLLMGIFYMIIIVSVILIIMLLLIIIAVIQHEINYSYSLELSERLVVRDLSHPQA